MNDGGVHHRATSHSKATLGQQRVDPFKHHFRESVRFQRTTKPQQTGGVRYALLSQINLRELAKHGRVIERLLARLVGQVEPQLQKVQSQHPLQANRRETITGFRVVRFDQCAQPNPLNQRVHLDEKFRLSGQPSVRREIKTVQSLAGKASLFHEPDFYASLLLNPSTTWQVTRSAFP